MKIYLATFALLLPCILAAQTKSDSVQRLDEVVIKAYFADQPVLKSPASASVIDSKQLSLQQSTSLVSAINTAPGVRMEERSPGSYRLSIRGSLLRSPFGVRNLKVYMDGLPITDAGGNTYINLLDAGNLGRLEILKGPEASVFGANSGGVVLIDPVSSKDSARVLADISGGSYGLFHETAGIQKLWKNYSLNINQAFQRSDGYRENSALNRNYIQTNQKYQYSSSGNLKLIAFYSDLQYETPGGLTKAQMDMDPRSARPATATLPGAADQHAAIYNKTFFGGLTNETSLFKDARFVLSVFGSTTDFKNPFITNYEKRREWTLGLRTYAEWNHVAANSSWKFNLGYESSQTGSDISNFNNDHGQPAAEQSSDYLKAFQSFAFSHLSYQSGRLFAEAALSLNFYKYYYKSYFPTVISQQSIKFDEQLMPRLALSYQVLQGFAWRASASRGYSPPTLAEIRSSNNVINTSLQPENGWNYETGFRLQSFSNRLWLDAVVFNYQLHDAIVRRLNDQDQEYFVNAGGTNQWGLETQLNFWLVRPNKRHIVRGVQLNNSYTLSYFKFKNYQNAEQNYSGNALTGVPKNIVVSSVSVQFPARLQLFIQHNYTSKLPLNDANSAFANSYNLVQAKLNWAHALKNNMLEFYVGADNLLNETYSLGNDLNAVGNRYFNPSPLRNYYAGISCHFSNK
ncbi:TonB-dependent receptor [Pedobacter sp. HMF7647]|uniref:TonB-dependent receptor n=1 Tax=Hufsiella arboris TaxID=2695275 RepID=A0A7K1Y8D0_9SPHI|nr:TonB-dependent receptor [Hufsiella arboris]MXV50853.1 TonB-dependent receptor [Hufsiella arboris]